MDFLVGSLQVHPILNDVEPKNAKIRTNECLDQTTTRLGLESSQSGCSTEGVQLVHFWAEQSQFNASCAQEVSLASVDRSTLRQSHHQRVLGSGRSTCVLSASRMSAQVLPVLENRV